jgi:hypothetical protein
VGRLRELGDQRQPLLDLLRASMSPTPVLTPSSCAIPPSDAYGSISGEAHVANFSVGPADPIGSPGPRIDISPVSSLVVTNTRAVPMRLHLWTRVRMLPFCEGSCQPDLKHELDIDGGGFVVTNQLIPGLGGAVALDPALGGDGTGNAVGINKLRAMGSESLVTISGGLLALPILAPGDAITIDHKLSLSYVGVWNATRLLFIFGGVTLLGVPA